MAVPRSTYPRFAAAFVLATASLASAAAHANGQFIWSGAFNGNGNNPVAIVADANDNIYTLGTFSGTVDLDPGAGTDNESTGSTSAYLSKLNSGGSELWGLSIPIVPADLTLTASNHLIISGSFSGTADMDPGAGTAFLTATDGADGCVVELTLGGGFVQAFAINGTGTQTVNDAAVDSSGNFIIAGTFEGTSDVDPSGGTSNISPTGARDVFVAKYDSNMVLQWAKAFNGTTGAVAQPNDIAIDSSDNVLVAGNFNLTYDFDPGAGTFNLSANDDLNPDIHSDVFVTKLDTSGNMVYAKRIGCSMADDTLGMGVDSGDNVVFTGYFQHEVDFDPGGGVDKVMALDKTDIYVLKLDANGDRVWVKFVMGMGTTEAHGLFIDSNDDLHITGLFNDSTDFDPGPGDHTLTETVSNASDTNHDIFVMKLTKDGEFVFARNYGNGNEVTGLAVTADSSRASISAGLFSGTVAFGDNPGEGDLTATSSTVNTYVLKLTGPISTAWVDFADPVANPDGSQAAPYGTFHQAVIALFEGGTIDIKGNSSVTNSPETTTVATPMTVQAVNGPVTIGAP